MPSAARWLARARGFGEENSDSAFATARFERKLGRLDRAGEALSRAADLGHDRSAVGFESRLIAAQSGTATDPQAELARLLESGQEPDEVAEAFVRGDIVSYRLDDALGLIGTWSEDFPNDPTPRYLAGRVQEHRADLPAAEREFEAALRAAPDHVPSAYNLGRILVSLRRPEDALARYESCVAALDEPLPALLGVAGCLREMRRFGEARETLERISAPSREGLEIACCIVGDPTEGAEARADEEWGRLESAEKRWDEAVGRFAAALEKNPRAWRVRYAYATALRQQGKTAEAAEQLRLYDEAKAALDGTDRIVDRLRKDPADVEARYTMGTVFLDHVSESQGLIWLESVLAYDPGHRPTHHALAEYYAGKADESPEFARLAEKHRALAGEPPP